MGRSGRAFLRSSISAFALLAVLAPNLAWADAVSLRAGERGAGARLVFEWPQAVGHTAVLEGNRVKLTFARPAETDVGGVAGVLPGWISGAARSADGREITLTLKRTVKLQSFASGNRVIVDLAPAATASASPTPEVQQAAPARPAAPAVRMADLRTGRHQGFDRAVITLAARPVVTQRDNKLVITAPASRRLSEAQLAQLHLPQVADVTQAIANDRLTLTFVLKPGVRASNFRVPSGIGIDFKDAPTAQVAQAAPSPAPPVPVAAPPRPPVTVAEVPAPAPVAPVVAPPAMPATPAPVAEAHAVPAVTAPASPDADTASAIVDATTSEEVTPPVAAAEAGLPPLEMTVGKDTPLAVFTRVNSLYVVVSDKNTPQELIPLVGSALASSPRVELLAAQGGRVIRIDTQGKPLVPAISATPTGWKIVFGDAPATGAPLVVKEERDYTLGARLFVAVSNPASPVLFVDPVVGDTLDVVPVPVAASGLPAAQRTVQAQFLPSYQGLVVRPWIDDLNVISGAEGIEISSISGLKLAEPIAGNNMPLVAPVQQGGLSAAALPTLPPLLDFASMPVPEEGKFTDERERLQQAIIHAADDDKKQAWLDLAKLYFVYGMPTEAAAIWQDVAKNDADLAKRPEFALIRAIAGFSSGTLDSVKAALTAVNQPTNDSSLWHGMLAVQEKDWVSASERFRPALDRIWEYPEPYMSRLAVAAIDTALQTQDYAQAEMLLNKLNDRYRMTERKPTPAVEYLTGALDWGREQEDEARAHLGSAAQSWNQMWRVRAELMLIDADIKDGRTRPADIMKRLERLRYAWRGDGLEFEILHKLAQQHIAANDFAAAFDDFAQMVAKYPDMAKRINVADEQKATFTRIFQGDDRDRTPAFSQLAIWDRYPEFRPTQPSVLSDVNLYMADRVAGIDLLDRAAGFYNEVLKVTTDPVAKANLGTKLAGLYLLDDKYAEAIKALDATEPPSVASQPSVLRGDARDERRMLRARAIFGQGKPDDALALLSNDYSDPATRLRADINWKARRWTETAVTLDALIGDSPPEGQPLTDEKSNLILNRATALALAGDRTALRDLRIKYGALMAATVDGPTFQLLTRPEVAGGLPDRATLSGRVAEVDLFQKFLERYRTPAAMLPETDGAAVAAAPATPPAGH